MKKKIFCLAIMMLFVAGCNSKEALLSPMPTEGVQEILSPVPTEAESLIDTSIATPMPEAIDVSTPTPTLTPTSTPKPTSAPKPTSTPIPTEVPEKVWKKAYMDYMMLGSKEFVKTPDFLI